jgi:hypothetical protein
MKFQIYQQVLSVWVERAKLTGSIKAIGIFFAVLLRHAKRRTDVPAFGRYVSQIGDSLRCLYVNSLQVCTVPVRKPRDQ